MARHLPIIESGRSNAPPLAGNAVRDIDREFRPAYAVWEITLRCDLQCLHCGSRAGKGRPDELSTEEALDLVVQMADLGVEEVSLIGGEAYLRDDWTVLARAIRDAGMDCGVVTGGRGLTLDRAKAARDAGVDSMSVSVDGLEASHDRQRGVAGSHRAALQALENLATVELPRSVNTQINNWNRTEISELIETLIPLGIHAWQIQFTVAMGRAVDNPGLLLEPYQMLELMPLVASLARRCAEAGVRIWPGNNVGYFGPYETLLRGDMEKGHCDSCTAGRWTLGIEANGDIKGCPSLPTRDYVGGNVRDSSLQQIWEQAPELRFTRGRTTEDLWGHCKTCYYAEDCLAGCTWTGHVLFGRRGNNPYCHHRALELLKQGRRERIVRTEQAPGAPFDCGAFELLEEDFPEAERETAEAIVATESGFFDLER